MERGCRPAARKHTIGHVAAQFQREHTRRVGCEGDRLKIEHQLHVLLERVGHADRRSRKLARLAARVVGLNFLNAPFDLSYVLQIVAETRAVRRAERQLQLANRVGDPIEDAAILPPPRKPRSWSRADAKQLIEDNARISDHGQRLLRRGPADRIGVDAGVVVRAAARLIDVLDAQLHRRNRRLLPDASRVDLIERRSGEHVGSLRLLRMRLREIHGGRSEVVRADFRRGEGFCAPAVGIAHDRQRIPVRFERREARAGEIELSADRGGRPHILLQAEHRASRRAVHHFNRDQARLWRDGARPCVAGGNHRLEKRQRRGDTQSLQHGAPGEVFAGKKHVQPSNLVIG